MKVKLKLHVQSYFSAMIKFIFTKCDDITGSIAMFFRTLCDDKIAMILPFPAVKCQARLFKSKNIRKSVLNCLKVYVTLLRIETLAP